MEGGPDREGEERVEDGRGKNRPIEIRFALAQTTDDRNALFDLCVAEDTSLKDVEVSVAFKANMGKKDQGGGVVWHYQDANNYYIARVNPLKTTFRVYKVVEQGSEEKPRIQIRRGQSSGRRMALAFGQDGRGQNRMFP